MNWEKILNYLSEALPHVIDFLGKAVLALVIYFVISRIIDRIAKGLKRFFAKIHVEKSLAGFIASMIKYGVLILTILTIVEKLGIVTQASIVAVLGSAGIAVSLALQGGLSNFAGGVIILFVKPFRAGDYIICQKENVEGKVVKIEMYYTTITTFDNQVYLVPNSALTNNTIKNVTALDRRKLEIKLGISYHSSTKRAKQLLQKLVEEDGRFLAQEREFFVDDLTENAVIVGFRAWVSGEDYCTARWEMLEKIKIRFEEEGLKLRRTEVDVRLHTQEKP